jgi:hypothetical protein
VKPCSVVVGYQRFGRRVEIQAAQQSETLVSYHINTRHGITIQTLIGIVLHINISFNYTSFIKEVHRVGIALGYRLHNRGSKLRFPAEAGNFSLHHRVQNDSGAHPASHPLGTRGSFPGGKAGGREADHSPPSNADVKNEWSYTSTPPISLHGVVLS